MDFLAKAKQKLWQVLPLVPTGYGDSPYASSCAVAGSPYLIDIDELIMTDVTLEIPFQLLCREDCKGLCPVCGSDLNEKTCNCTQKQIDPRLEKLKMLLDS